MVMLVFKANAGLVIKLHDTGEMVKVPAALARTTGSARKVLIIALARTMPTVFTSCNQVRE